LSLIQTKDAVTVNLASNFTGVLTEDHIALYIGGQDKNSCKLGEIVSVNGKTPNEAFIDTYNHAKRVLTKDHEWNSFGFLILDKQEGKTKWYDNDFREYIDKKGRQNRIDFRAIYIKNRDGEHNAEELLKFNFDKDFNTLVTLAKSWLGLDPTFNTKTNWNPRPHQPDAITEAVRILFSPSDQCLFAAYPSYGKTGCSLKIAHDYLSNGGICLLTTPVVDTIQGFIDNLDEYRFGSPDLKVSVYDKNTILTQDPKDLRKRANSGELIFILLSVQGMRRDSEYFDRDGIDVTEEAKYFKFVKDVDLWIPDEFHREYGGSQTSAFFQTVKPKKKLPLTATPMLILDQFDSEEMVIRTLAWGLKNRSLTKLPSVYIQSLNKAFYNIRPELQSLYSEEEGFDPRKWFDVIAGTFVHSQALLDLSEKQFFSALSKNKNPLSISNDKSRCSNSNLGMIIIPEGSNGRSAEDNAELYCKDHNEHFSSRRTLWISSYKIDRERKSLTVNEYVQSLLNDYDRVIIVTHRKFTTGTDIPALSFLVLLDKIGSIVEFEQVLGRLARIFEGKDRVCLYAFCPGNDLKINVVRMAQANAKYYKSSDPVKFLECLPITEYDGSSLNDTDPEEMLEEFWDNQRDKLKLRLPTQAIDSFFRSNPDLVELWKKLDENLKSGTGLSYGLGDSNNSKIKDSKKKSKAKKPPVKVGNLKDWIETFRTVWNEVPAFGLLLGHRHIHKAVGCAPMRMMFSDQVIDTVLSSFKTEPALKKRMQQELDKYLDSCQSLSVEDQFKYVFKNSSYKMDQGLVYLRSEVAARQVNAVQYNAEIVFILNALNGTYVLEAKKRWPNAKIICIDHWPFYAEHLKNLGAEFYQVNMHDPEEFELGIKKIIEALKMKSRPVLLTNPPYTDGTQGANEIYTAIIDRAINLIDPIAICSVTPENLINGGQKKETLRKKILKNYGLKNVDFLEQNRDWKGDISVDTISLVAEEDYSGLTEVRGRFLNTTYNVDMSNFTELINGETQDIHDWLISAQTTEKLKLLTSVNLGTSGLQIKISKDALDSLEIENGNEHKSHNTEWRVAFGYMRCNTCAVVPPGPSIPGKYRYVTFGSNEDNARKFAQYMLSEPVRFIMMLTYTSRTLDNPQLAYVPMLDLSQFNVISNEVLYNFWNTPKDTQIKINAMVGDKVTF
jgi:superfamily II DNA or RNA helicase